jgi:hypothetical protein
MRLQEGGVVSVQPKHTGPGDISHRVDLGTLPIRQASLGEGLDHHPALQSPRRAYLAVNA